MPIRFRCQRCSQLLGIASRKVGTEIACPKCGCPQIVPAESTVPASAAQQTSDSATPEAPLTGADLMAYDDPPAAEAEQATAARASPLAQAVAALPRESSLAGPAGQPVPSGMILYPRRTFYIHGLLFLILAAVAFGSGYFIGRGDATYEKQLAQENAAKQRVPMEFKVVYDPGTGKIAGDENSVIIVLPAEKTPEKTLSITGIRPQDPPPPENHKSLEMIRNLGGAYGRADAEGNFYLVVPDQGKYRVLVISAHAARPAGSSVDEADLSEMQNYFTMAESLVNRYKYRWTLEDIRIGFGRIEVDFGRDGR